MKKLGTDKGRKPSILRKIFVDNSYCWASLLCTVGIMMLIFYCYDLFPFGGKTILRMDLYHQYGPLFAELYDRVTNLKSLIYSWNTGLGGPFLGNYFNYLSSPSAVIMLILGHRNMPEAIAGMILVKAALSAYTFTYYLKKSQNRHDFTTAGFGILYAMCGYFVAYYWNVMWIDAMVYFPLVILGIENIINKRKSGCYIAFLALTLVSNYYMGYMTCIFSVIYFIIYFLSCFDFNSLYPETPYTLTDEGKKKYKFRHKLSGNVFIRSGIRFAFSSIAAAGLVAFALIPTYLILKNCSATSGKMPSLEDYKSYFSVFDFLANHLASVNPTIRSSGEDVLPNVYCGIAPLILVPLYLFSKKITLKEKVAHVALLGIIFFSFNINILNYIWHGFHFPNDLPYRFSFMYSFILLSMAYKAFVNLHEYTGRQILGAGVALIFMIIFIQETGSKNVEDITLFISVVFTIAYCLIFYISNDKRYSESAVAILLLCCIIGEIACSNTNRFSMDQTKESFVSDYSDFKALKTELDKKAKTENYRMELTYNRARMDPSWFGYNGISTFSSMAYEKMANVQSDLGVSGNYINSYTYYPQTPIYNMMHSLKYIVDNNDDVELTDDYYTKVGEKGKFTAYENKYCLPIGMAVDASLGEWYTGYNNPFTVQSDWLEYSTGVSDAFGMMDFFDIKYYNMDEITSGFDTGDLYFNKTGEGVGELTFNLKSPAKRHCYLYVKSDCFDSISITKGEYTIDQDIDEPYIYDLGIVDVGEKVTVVISVEKYEYGYIDFYPCYVNDYAIDEAYNKLKANSLNITSFNATDIKGTVKADASGLFFTSIPYDKSWKVFVDGKAIAEKDYVSLCDAYLCFNISKGDHTIELKYEQEGLLLGLYVSAASLFAILLAAMIISFKKKKALKKALAESEGSVVFVDETADTDTSAIIEYIADEEGSSPEAERDDESPADTAEENGDDANTEAVEVTETISEEVDKIEIGDDSTPETTEIIEQSYEDLTNVINDMFAEFEWIDDNNSETENINDDSQNNEE